ncbi:hypothetical protein [uncultured Subdoligranulum sp.]|uniref:hypothetical protein n=1 Tax=uncultured Subdoligranulum sp. TaxID=512298 RepID=UPI0026020768|nr:hypothetical protein [uncultured Subdoligranulum sp.]
MRHAGKRIVSSLCALALLAAMLPAQAMATGTTEPGASVQQELSETSDGETKTDTDASNVSGQAGGQNSGENQDDLNSGEKQDDQTPDEEEKESAAEGNETDLSEDEKDEKTDGADLSGDDTTEADGSRESAGGENGSGSQNGQNGGAEQGNLPPSNDGAETLEEPASGETENGNGETETTPQAEGDVARIGDTTYATLDKAIAAATDGATIELLADAVTSGISIKNLNLSIKSAEGITTPLKITFNQRGIHAVNSTLTFSNVIVDMTVSSHPEIEGNTANLIDDSNLIFVNSRVSIKNDHSDTGGESAIYLYQGSNLYVQDGSSLEISEFNDTYQDSGIYADGSERDDSLPHFQIQISNSSMISIQNCGWAGLTVNPCDITVSEDSRLTVAECGANGGKQGLGCYYGKLTVMDCSEVNVSENPGADWGIFIKDLKVDETSSLIANDNTGDGIAIGGVAEISSGATIKASHNGDAGMRVYVSGETWAGNVTIEDGAKAEFIGNGAAGISNSNCLVVEKGADVTITGNKVSGIRNNSNATATLDGNVKIEENQGSGIYNLGGTLTMNAGTIMNNSTTTYGGGVYNTGTLTLSDNVRIYNNHAKNPSINSSAGDDIFNDTTATITFGKVGSNWNLDDCKNDEGNTVEGCTAGGVIDGWYDDSANEVSEDGNVTSYNRWNAHDGDNIYHVEKYTFTDGVTTVNGPLSLKAAHGASATLQPADITIYMGGEDGYDGVLGNGEAQSSNSLPTPGFYFTLPADLNQVLSNALGKDPTTAIDLSGLVTVTATGDDNKARTWKLERYGVEGGSSTAIVDEASGLEHFIYKIVPVEDEQDPVRVQFTDPETGETIISDKFDPDTALHNEYTMELYTGGVNPNSITMEFTLPEEKGGQTYTCGYDQENSKSGTLTVRYANNDALIIDAVEDMDAAIAKEDEMFYVEADSDQSFFINEQDLNSDKELTGVEVDFTDVSLLADDIITQERADALYDRAEQAAESAGLENVNMFAKYFDLVDKENGNAWLTPADGETVTVYWPYPAGTDKNTEFKLYHFEGLDREMQVEDVEREVYDAEMVDMKITKGETGITFETGSFSPFVLAWENPAEQPSGGSGSEENPAPTATPQPTPAPAEAEPVAAPAAAAVPQTGDDMPIALLGVSAAGAAVVFVALLAVRKRRHGQD